MTVVSLPGGAASRPDVLSVARRRLVCGWVGLVVLAFNILGGFVLPARAADGFGGDAIMVVCTAAGLVSVDVGAQQSGQDGRVRQDGLCQFCLPLLHGGAVSCAAPALVVRFETTATSIAWAVVGRSVPVRLGWGAQSVRGPPLV